MAMNVMQHDRQTDGGALSKSTMSSATESTLRHEVDRLEVLFAPLQKDEPNHSTVRTADRFAQVLAAVDKVEALLKQANEEGGAGAQKQVVLIRNAKEAIEAAKAAMLRGAAK